MTDASAPPANAAEARARLDALTADKAWGDKLFAGDVATNREFHELAAMAAKGDHTDALMSGVGSKGNFINSDDRNAVSMIGHLREKGIPDDAIRQAIAGSPVSQAEHDAAKRSQNRLMADQEWCKRYSAGNGPENEQMTLINIVLSSPIKESA